MASVSGLWLLGEGIADEVNDGMSSYKKQLADYLSEDQDLPKYLVVRKQFLSFVARVNGVVFDAHDAYQLLHARWKERASKLEESPSHGRSDKSQEADVERQLFHHWSQRMVQRTEKGGPHLALIIRYCLVTIYQYWEENVRPEIAESLGVEKNDIKHAAFGNLRKMRTAIIHNNAIATEKVENNEVFKWFNRGQPINIELEQYCEFSGVVSRLLADHDVLPKSQQRLVEKLRSFEYL